MSQAVAQPGVSVSVAPRTTWIDGLFLACFLAHLPLAMEYSRRMWSFGHYQYFPLLAIAAGWILIDRLAELPRQVERTVWTYRLLTLSSLMLTASVLLYSPFAWVVSLLFLIAIYVFDRWGWPGVRTAAPGWLLLLLAVPLPANLDLKLITQMQFLSSQLASWILDAFGQVHFREGVVLVTEQKQFFTEEACSGIRSLFSSLAAISIYGVFQRYPVWRHLFNLGQTVLWVIVGNAIRVAAVVYLADHVHESFAVGTTHEMLGLAAFLLIFLCAFSTDRSLEVWRSVPFDAMDDALADPEATVPERRYPQRSRPSQADPRLLWKGGLILILILVGGFAARLTYARLVEDRLQNHLIGNVTIWRQTDLPMNIGPWQQVEFEHVLRDDTRLLAPESHLWTYRQGNQTVRISLDSPYYDFHNLNDCYEGFGWDVEVEHRYSPDRQRLETAENLTALTMTKPNLRGLVLFTAFDRDGNLVQPTHATYRGPTRWMEVQRNIRLATGTLNQQSDPRVANAPLPIRQVQLLYQSPGEIKQRADLEALFVQLRQRLRSPSLAAPSARP